MSEAPAGCFVATDAHRRCAATVMAASRDHGSCVITSLVPGVGKTRSVTVAAATTGHRCLLLSPSPQTNVASITAELLIAAGVRPPHRAPLWELTVELLDVLADHAPALTVIDNAHHLTGEVLAHLQVLHQRAPRNTLVLVASHTLTRRDRGLHELLDRPDRWIDMPSLPPDATLPALHATHPIFSTAPPARLADIDQHWAHGRWRRWDQFLRVALPYTNDGADTLDHRKIDHTLTALGWTHRPDPTRRDR